MRLFFVVALATVALLCMVTGAQSANLIAAPASADKCRTTQAEFRWYVKRVYRRPVISARALRKIGMMRWCAATPQARRNMLRLLRREARLREARMCSNSNPLACIRDAANYHGVSYSWLVACANSEGGTGPSDYDTPNTQGSGATGNFQFMPRTFWGYVGKSGAPKPWIYLSSEDQAYTAAYMFKIGESGQWTGEGC